MKIASSYAFREHSSAEAVEASFKIAYLIALAKKPHNIEETLIKLCMLKAASLVLGKANTELANISFSDSTVKTRIDVTAEDIKLQVLEKTNKSCAFAMQCLRCWVTSALLDLLQLKKKGYFANPCKRLSNQKMCLKLFLLLRPQFNQMGKPCGYLHGWSS